MKRFRLKVALALAAALVATVAAWAFYTGPGVGTGHGAVGSFDAATISVPATSTGSHAVTWTQQATLSDTGRDSQITYRVQRRLNTGSYANVASGPCSGDLPRPTTSCTDTVTSAGSYAYRVIARYTGWTATSNEAGPVVATLAVAPAAPTSVSLANGGGVGNAYINGANKGSLSVNVALGGTSLPTDTVHVTITDGSSTTADRTASATTGAGTVTVTGIDATSLNDGSATIRATSANAGASSGQTTTAVTKDTVKPTASAATVTGITSGNTFSVPYSSGDTSPSSDLQKVELYVDTPGAPATFSLANTDGSPSATGESFSYTGATSDGTYGFYTLAYDKAGNVEDAPTAAEQTATRNTTPPTVTAGAIAKTEGLPNSTAGWLRAATGNLGSYRIYASVSAGGPAISTVVANTSSLPGGAASVALSPCSSSCTVNGVSYNYVSAELTTVNTNQQTVRGFSVTATDANGQAHTLGDTSSSSTLKVTVDNAAPTTPNNGALSTTNVSGGGIGLPQLGDKINFTYSEPIEGISVVGGWFFPWTSASEDVRVRFINNSSGPDGLSITNASGSTALLGTLAFNTGADFVSGGDVIFGGSGASQASTLTVSGNTITVTLGSQNGGGGSPITDSDSQSLTWTPDVATASAVYDRAGNRIASNTARSTANNTKQF